MKGEQVKRAEAVGSGTADPSTAPARQTSVPQLSVESKPAPGQRGPKGMAGRTTYSRVNTGLPPIPDAGTMQQKTQSPRGMEFLPKLASQENNHMSTSTQGRPKLQDLIKVAMEGAASKVDVSLEAARYMTGGTAEQTKTASAKPSEESISTDLIHKLAAAGQYAARRMDPKLASTNFPDSGSLGPGVGPNTLEVEAATSEGDGVMEAGQSGKATTQNQVPTNPSTQKDPTRSADPGTGLETNDGMQHPEIGEEVVKNEKTTLSNEGVSADKTAQATYLNNLVAVGLLKVAAQADGSVQLVPANERVKQAFLSDTMGAARGVAGGVGGGVSGGIGGGLLGTGLGALAGGLTGLGAGKGAALGGLIGAGAGSLYGGTRGAQMLANPMGKVGSAQTKTAGKTKVAKGYQTKKDPEDMQPLERFGRRAGALGGIVGGAKGGAALAGKAKGGNLAKLVAGIGGAALGGHVASRLGGAAGAKAAKGLDKVDPGGKTKKKTAAVASAMVASLKKTAFPEQTMLSNNLRVLGLLKQAEDAINPASISAGKTGAVGATPPKGASPSEEGVPSEPSDVTSQKGKMLASNQAAIDFTKRDAKADPKGDAGDVITEPAQTKSTDTVLQQALEHTDEAGAKIAAANLTRVAASRAVLQKLAEAHVPAVKKKTAQGMGGGAPSNPQAASGFNAAGQM